MAKEKGEKKEKKEKVKRGEFKPEINSATAVIGAIAFLQKTGFAATPKNIKACIVQRSRKPGEHIMEHLPNYLSRGLELGILRKFNGTYKIGNITIRKRKKRIVKNQVKKSTPTKVQETPEVATGSMSKKSSACAC